MYVCMLRISGNGSKLTVLRAQTADGGKYTCVATNAAGEEDRIFNLNVYGGFNSGFKRNAYLWRKYSFI